MTHVQAPLSIRERFSLTKSCIEKFYNIITHKPVFKECVVLNTCNRIEFYTVEPCFQTSACIQDMVHTWYNVSPHYLKPYSFYLNNEAVVQHLFKVTAGINSQILGEPEVFGQVKEAYQTATTHQATGPILNCIFQRSFQAAKWARSRADLGKGPVSLGSVVTQLALRIFGSIRPLKVLVIGSGSVANSIVASLQLKGALDITLVLRNLKAIESKYSSSKAALIEIHELPVALKTADIIIGSTGSQVPILYKECVSAALSHRGMKPLFIIDVAVPRDFDSSILELPNVYLYNLDDIATMANNYLKERVAQAYACEPILLNKAKNLWAHVQDRFNLID